MSDARQLLGMKGASGTTNIWKLRLQLMKPVTWIPLIWGVICGAAASGQYEWRPDHVLAAIACMVLSAVSPACHQTLADLLEVRVDHLHRVVKLERAAVLVMRRRDNVVVTSPKR